MVDTGIGRLLISSLHEAITEVMPTRLDFYEHWLTPSGMRDGRIGQAPFGAVLSFLRREGPETYGRVMAFAGECSADWSFAEVSSVERGLVRRLPGSLRARGALRLSRRVVRATFDKSRVKVRLRRGTGTIEIRDSIFCTLRDVTPDPMCGYYAAAIQRFLERFDVDADVSVAQCRASGAPACTLEVVLRGARADAATAAAA